MDITRDAKVRGSSINGHWSASLIWRGELNLDRKIKCRVNLTVPDTLDVNHGQSLEKLG